MFIFKRNERISKSSGYLTLFYFQGHCTFRVGFIPGEKELSAVCWESRSWRKDPHHRVSEVWLAPAGSNLGLPLKWGVKSPPCHVARTVPSPSTPAAPDTGAGLLTVHRLLSQHSFLTAPKEKDYKRNATVWENLFHWPQFHWIFYGSVMFHIWRGQFNNGIISIFLSHIHIYIYVYVYMENIYTGEYITPYIFVAATDTVKYMGERRWARWRYRDNVASKNITISQ